MSRAGTGVTVLIGLLAGVGAVAGVTAYLLVSSFLDMLEIIGSDH